MYTNPTTPSLLMATIEKEMEKKKESTANSQVTTWDCRRGAHFYLYESNRWTLNFCLSYLVAENLQRNLLHAVGRREIQTHGCHSLLLFTAMSSQNSSPLALRKNVGKHFLHMIYTSCLDVHGDFTLHNLNFLISGIPFPPVSIFFLTRYST